MGRRAHFFAAAAESIRILIDYARQKRRAKRGGGAHRIELDDALLIPTIEMMKHSD